MAYNPFTKGSQRYDITERQNKGDSKAKIVKDLKLKNKEAIYRVNTELNRRRKLADITKQVDPKEKPPVGTLKGNETDPDTPPTPTFVPQGSAFSPQGGAASPGGRIEVMIEQPSMTKKTLWIYSKVLVLFDLARQGHFDGALRNFQGNESDFFNLVTEDYFRIRYNAGVGLMSRRFA